jgi:hypothetical protein
VDDLVGADPRALEAKIKAKMGEANYFPGGGKYANNFHCYFAIFVPFAGRN